VKHYIYRDTCNAGAILLACDAQDIIEADRRFAMHTGIKASARHIGVQVIEIVTSDGTSQCVLPHTVGAKYLIRLASETKPKSPKVNLSPRAIPGIRLFPNVTPRQFHMSCFYCGKNMEGVNRKRNPKDARTKDHVTPLSRGGKLKVPACYECNQLKRNLKLEEYRVMVAYRNGLIPIEILQPVKFAGEMLAKFEPEAPEPKPDDQAEAASTC